MRKAEIKKNNKKRESNIRHWLVSRQLWFYDLNIDQLSLKSTRRISIIFHIMLFLKTLKICNRKLLTGVWKTAKWRLGANIQTQFSLFIIKRWVLYFFFEFSVILEQPWCNQLIILINFWSSFARSWRWWPFFWVMAAVGWNMDVAATRWKTTPHGTLKRKYFLRLAI